MKVDLGQCKDNPAVDVYVKECGGHLLRRFEARGALAKALLTASPASFAFASALIGLLAAALGGVIFARRACLRALQPCHDDSDTRAFEVAGAETPLATPVLETESIPLVTHLDHGSSTVHKAEASDTLRHLPRA
jgi:fructose/tagatose bisphosphate aldolase